MDFQYTAKSTASDSVSGLLSAAGETDARKQLRERGLFVTSLRPQRRASLLSIGTHPQRRRIKRQALLSLTTQLAIMTRAGIDPASALECVVQHCRDKKLQSVLRDVLNAVQEGKSLSDGLRLHPHVFDETFTASLAAGEQAGELPKVLHHLVQLLRRDISRTATIRGLVAYPLILVSVSGMVTLALVCFVLPEFARVFQDMEMSLPALTKLLMAVTGFLRQTAFVWVPSLLLLTVSAILAYRSPAGRRVADHLVLNLAVLKDVTRSLMVGRTFRLLGMLLESGVTALDGVRLVGRSVKNRSFRALFRQMEDDLLNGRTLSHSLSGIDVLPPESAEMILTAERTGTLGMVTLMMGEHYEEQGEGRLRDLITLLEPAIVIGMGFLVGSIILAVMLPMFDIATAAGG